MSAWQLSSVALQNFKSFKEKTQFPVPSGQLIGIVGPNGCGKSNLLEAMCFATGCPVADMRAKLLKDLQCTDAPTQVVVLCWVLSQCVTSAISGKIHYQWRPYIGSAPYVAHDLTSPTNTPKHNLALQVCCVQLTFSKGKQNQLLETTLTPEGTRLYRINGKLQTGKQVKVSNPSLSQDPTCHLHVVHGQ